MSYNIATLNVHGLRDKKKAALLAFLFTKKCFDILFLQESHITSEIEGGHIGKLFNAVAFWSYGQKHSKGVGILLNSSLKDSVVSSFHDQEGRLIGIDLKYTILIFVL